MSFLQRSLNALNRAQRSFPNLVVDGRFGRRTADALNIILHHGEAGILWKMLNVLQGNHYLEYMAQSEEQERYARGWFTRVFEASSHAA